MKKVLAGILVATTVLGLVGCGNSGTKDSSKDNADKKEIVYGKSQGPYTELLKMRSFRSWKKRLYSERCGSVRSSDSRYRPE